MKFDAVYYEPDSLAYPLGRQLQETFGGIPWIPIASHNSIKEMQEKPNSEFGKMKRNLIVGIRKTHKYVENQKVSDYLVPYTSSGCTAMCLYCYLVCNYNKCAYLRLFVNREQMLDRIIKRGRESETPLTFEIGSNSDLVLENTITGNLLYTIPRFAKEGTGSITFPTKFHMVDPLLDLDHQGRTIFRMSVNPEQVIKKIELGTSSLAKRIEAVNRCVSETDACGVLRITPISEDTVRVSFAKEELDSLAPIPEEIIPTPGLAWNCREVKNIVEITFGKLLLRVDKKTSVISFYNRQGQLLLTEGTPLPRQIAGSPKPQSWAYFNWTKKEKLKARGSYDKQLLELKSAAKYISIGAKSGRPACLISCLLYTSSGIPYASGWHLLVGDKEEGYHTDAWHRSRPDPGIRPIIERLCGCRDCGGRYSEMEF